MSGKQTGRRAHFYTAGEDWKVRENGEVVEVVPRSLTSSIILLVGWGAFCSYVIVELARRGMIPNVAMTLGMVCLWLALAGFITIKWLYYSLGALFLFDRRSGQISLPRLEIQRDREACERFVVTGQSPPFGDGPKQWQLSLEARSEAGISRFPVVQATIYRPVAKLAQQLSDLTGIQTLEE